MEALLAIVGTLLVAVIGWLLYHSSQCSKIHERVARLEEHLRMKEP